MKEKVMLIFVVASTFRQANLDVYYQQSQSTVSNRSSFFFHFLLFFFIYMNNLQYLTTYHPFVFSSFFIGLTGM